MRCESDMTNKEVPCTRRQQDNQNRMPAALRSATHVGADSECWRGDVTLPLLPHSAGVNNPSTLCSGLLLLCFFKV